MAEEGEFIFVYFAPLKLYFAPLKLYFAPLKLYFILLLLPIARRTALGYFLIFSNIF